MTSKTSNHTFVCMLTTQLYFERTISSMYRSSKCRIVTIMNSLTWLMESNVWKCATVPIDKTTNTSIYKYSIIGETVERLDDHEYLGIAWTHYLHWKEHYNKILKLLNGLKVMSILALQVLMIFIGKSIVIR